jgi:hypothetical protein
MANAMAIHTDNCFTTYNSVVSGTTTTPAQIDTAFKAIPASG